MEPWRAELYHHGIKGMKWGIRRFQNKDGTLTEAGKKRKEIYDPVNQFNESQNKYYQAKKQTNDNLTGIGREGLNIGREGLKVYDRFASRKQAPPADLSSMTDKELQQRINRLNMEQQYRRLTESADVPQGRQFAEDVLAVGGSALAVTSSALAIALSIKQLRGGI